MGEVGEGGEWIVRLAFGVVSRVAVRVGDEGGRREVEAARDEESWDIAWKDAFRDSSEASRVSALDFI